MINKIILLVKKPFLKFKTFSLKKKIITLVILLIVLPLSLQFFNKNGKPKYTTEKVTRGDIVETVTETGSVANTSRSDIYSPSTGIVETVLIKNGDYVKAGQELFTIVSSATEQEKNSALASYLTAKNSLDTANATLLSLQATMFEKWDIFRELAESADYETGEGNPRFENRALPEFHIPEKEWLAAEANYKKQQAVINQAQAAVSSTYLLYQATQNATVKANADGTIYNLSVKEGSGVKINTVASPQTPLTTIANLGSTEVVVSLTETDIAKVKEGQEAQFDVNAVDNKTYAGYVTRVDTIGTSEGGVIRYRVYFNLTDGDDKLRPGMNTDVKITTNKLNSVIAVPNSAIKPYQGGRAVRVVGEKGDLKYLPVEIGIKGEDKTEITKGLTEGQEIITSLTNEQIKRPGLFGN